VTRKLNDGREFRIVKRFLRADSLRDALAGSSWRVAARETQSYFLYAEATRG
jgi:hypothetical protein